MKNHYPYLVYWKEQGLEDFPSDPPDIIYEMKAEPLRKAIRSGLEKYQLPQFIKDDIANDYEPVVEQMVAIQLEGEIYAASRKEAVPIYDARKKLQKSDDINTRKQVLTELGGKTLQNTRGGGTALFENQRRILKRIYLEMLDCTKLVWSKLGIRRNEYDDWGYDESERIKEWIPEIGLIFTDEELPLLTRHSLMTKYKKDNPPSPYLRDIAADIILRRLKKYSTRFRDISIRHFQDRVVGTVSCIPPFDPTT